MNAFAILGSGYGLYGYLPALISCSYRILLPTRYRPAFVARQELNAYANQIEWVENEFSLLQQSQAMVIALSPALQSKWLMHGMENANIKHLLLEKPLAESPKAAAIVLTNLISSKKNFRIGYTFRYTLWGKELLTVLKNKHNISHISLHWFFKAHHFHQDLQTWKRFHNAGGGVIRFYGIHFIALLAEIGYNEVLCSTTDSVLKNECEKWRAVFYGNNLPRFEIVIDSRASLNQFMINKRINTENETRWWHLHDPFNKSPFSKPSETLDYRVPVISQLCQSLREPHSNEYQWYVSTIKLWSAVEDKNLFKEGSWHEKIN